MTRHRTVADVMTRDVVTAEPATTYKELVRLMNGHGISGLPVVAGDGRPIGVVTRTDLLVKEGHPDLEPTSPRLELPSHRAERRKASAQVASELMTAPPVTVHAGTRLTRAARRMAEAGIERLLVVDDEGRLTGIVSREDVLLVFLRTDEEIREEIVNRVILRDWLMDPDRFVVRVRDGVVSLQGRIERRSLIPSLIKVIRGIDGVVAIDARLSWDEDDTVKPARSELIT